MIVIIFGLLYTTFGSVSQALLVLMNVPFALVGGIAALWLRHMNLNLSASVSFIALSLFYAWIFSRATNRL